jgi:predicted DsbA family dithiol-disulfide isomerase
MKVEIWSDVVCPWCYIGKRRFEKALARFEHRDQVEITWRSYQLEPDAHYTQGESVQDGLVQTMNITPERAAAMNRQVTAEAAKEGLEYHLDQAKAANTLDAHRLLHFAASQGLQAELEERLFKAHFVDGTSIGEQQNLVQLASEVGLDAEAARAVLASDQYTDEVRADQKKARELWVSGVPFFVIEDREGIGGAQPSAVFLEALRKVWKEVHPKLHIIGTSGEEGTCSGGVCSI